MNKRFLLIALLLIAAGVGYYGWHEYNRKPAGTKNAEADITITADSLLMAFTVDENAANTRFNEKVVEVSGKVKDVESESGKVNVSLATTDALAGVMCEFNAADPPQVRTGDNVRIKGVCTGYLIDVVLVRCSVVE
jgi:hypothetical protein